MAAQCFQKIVESEGELFKADAYFNLGRMYEAVSNPEKAREAYDKLEASGQLPVDIPHDRIIARLTKQKSLARRAARAHRSSGLGHVGERQRRLDREETYGPLLAM